MLIKLARLVYSLAVEHMFYCLTLPNNYEFSLIASGYPAQLVTLGLYLTFDC